MTPIIIGDSVTGDSHIRHNIERQDSFSIVDGVHKHSCSKSFMTYYKDLPDNVKIVAVADGHGSSSCPYSKTGSQTAVNVFCDIMAEYAVKYKNNMKELFVTLNREGETTRISKGIVSEWEKRIISVHRMNGRNDSDDLRDNYSIWKKYGTTLLGMMITEDFVFTFQLGDGDITYVDNNKISPVIKGDKILGVETHSISKPDSWKKVLTRVIQLNPVADKPFMYILSTDGWVNSHASETDFQKTCSEYFKIIQEYGTKTVEDNLSAWLSETSKMGCGDDITVVCVYFKQ